MTIVVGWELSWYRYEVDLGNEAAGVRVAAQGTELAELTRPTRSPTPRPTMPASCTLAALADRVACTKVSRR